MMKSSKWSTKNQNSIILSKFDRNYLKANQFSKVIQVIYSSAPTSVPNIKALAQILFDKSYTQDFQILSSKDITQKSINRS